MAVSLPEYGFSDRPAAGEMTEPKIADLCHTLMNERLGYPRYAVRGSDWGAAS